ncbi:VanZ family protein [Eubacterium ramulus]
MSQYLEALQQAMFIFPIIVILFTVPYIAWSYHKYGSVLSLRVLIVYSFILYLLCVYCLVILPLPTPEKAATLHGHKAQLVPFSFVADIAKQAQIQPGQPASWLSIFTGSAFWTTVFNLFMTMPFGVYLRYYFCYNWRKTLRLSFLLSLFFELTQLSGLYFVYPGSYRLFDVDDLIVNTAGSMIGFALAGPVSRLLPTRQELDTVSFRRGASISFTRRVFSFLADMACLTFASGILAVVVVSFGITLSIRWMPVLFIAYFGLLSILLHGQTPGKRLTRMRIVQRNDNTAHWYQYFLRYGLLIAGLVGAPYCLNRLLFILMDVLHLNSLASLVLHGLLIGGYLFWLFFAGIRMALHKPLFYERWSRTKLISTVKHT